MNKPLTVEQKYNHFIGGKWVEPATGEYFTLMNPVTGEPLSQLARGSEKDVNKALESAKQGFETWSNLEPGERGRILTNIARKIREHKMHLTYLETMDTGRPLLHSEGIVDTSARFFEYMGGVADKIMGENIPARNDYLTYTIREPYGIVGHIIPWNAPLQTCSRDIASALAAGNAVVTKISENAGIAVFELAKLCVEAGLPEGVFNVLSGYGFEAGDALIHHPDVGKISFTGSVRTGQLIMKAAAEQIVPVTVELGGKSPNIVFEDANLEEATAISIRSFTFNTGQVCAATTRIFVQRTIIDDFVERMKESMKQMKVGGGLDNVTIGPLISEEQMNVVLNYIEKGKEEGARIAYGGKQMMDDDLEQGYFVEPTLFVDADNNMAISQEEIFGPVVVIIPFDTEEEAIEMANDTEFGLAAMIWTENIRKAHRVAKKIQAGEIYINDFMPISVEAPFGGYKKSGIGRAKGLESIRGYTQVKTITAKIGG